MMLGLRKLPKTVVLVGMMGVGKTSIGRKLAKKLEVTFCDSDHEVEQAAAFSVADIYEWYGEQAFKDTEQRVITRLLTEKEPHVLSTGVEAFINPEIRELVKRDAFSVWLKASIDTIYPRVIRRDHRPQLKNSDKRQALEKYIEDYSPIYSQADFDVDCDNHSPDQTVALIEKELGRLFWNEE